MSNTREMMGEAACLDALVAKTLTSFEDDAVKKIASRALSRHTALTNIKLPNHKLSPYLV